MNMAELGSYKLLDVEEILTKGTRLLQVVVIVARILLHLAAFDVPGLLRK